MSIRHFGGRDVPCSTRARCSVLRRQLLRPITTTSLSRRCRKRVSILPFLETRGKVSTTLPAVGSRTLRLRASILRLFTRDERLRSAIQQGEQLRFLQIRSLSLTPLSASAAVFAGIVSLLNGARISSGQSPLGFLNPFIYSVGFRGLNDIVDGGSTGCTGTDLYSGLQTPFVPFASWNATKGWDPVTGYGTPDFRKLLSISRRYPRGPASSEQKGGNLEVD